MARCRYYLFNHLVSFENKFVFICLILFFCALLSHARTVYPFIVFLTLNSEGWNFFLIIFYRHLKGEKACWRTNRTSWKARRPSGWSDAAAARRASAGGRCEPRARGFLGGYMRGWEVIFGTYNRTKAPTTPDRLSIFILMHLLFLKWVLMN